MSRKRILVSPLDWGLGHATRCIPVINSLIKNGVDVVISADGYPLAVLKEEFPDLEFIQLPGYNIKYPKKKVLNFKILFQTPKILNKIKQEHKSLQEIITDYKIDAVISDNRFGLHTTKIPCVFLSHQIHIQAPLMKRSLYKANKKFIEKYTECWIPDYSGRSNLSGILSHSYEMPSNIKYIGPLSRFNVDDRRGDNFEYEIAAILSGPEPQRAILEKKVITQLKRLKLKSIVVRGVPDGKKIHGLPDYIQQVGYMSSTALKEVIQQSKFIVSRSGYSSIMDFFVLGKKACLVPTPGQTEQEYLAKYHKSKGWFNISQQKDLNLKEALANIDNYQPSNIVESGVDLDTIVREFLSKL